MFLSRHNRSISICLPSWPLQLYSGLVMAFIYWYYHWQEESKTASKMAKTVPWIFILSKQDGRQILNTQDGSLNLIRFIHWVKHVTSNCFKKLKRAYSSSPPPCPILSFSSSSHILFPIPPPPITSSSSWLYPTVPPPHYILNVSPLASLFPVCIHSVSSMYPICILTVSSLSPHYILTVSTATTTNITTIILTITTTTIIITITSLYSRCIPTKAWKWPLRDVKW